MNIDNKQTEFLLKADLFRLLSKGYSYPDAETVSEVEQMLDELTGMTPLDELKKYLNLEELQAEYSRLFMKGAIPTTETATHPRYEVLGELAGYYKAFGLTPKTGFSPDSLPYELEFASILCLKIALAEKEEDRQTALEAYRRFVGEHLADFAENFEARLKAAGPHPFYENLSRLLARLVISKSGKKRSGSFPLPIHEPETDPPQPFEV